MRLSAVYNSVVIASFASNALAKIWFDPVASKLSPGDSLQLKWTTDHDYNLQLVLVSRPLPDPTSSASITPGQDDFFSQSLDIFNSLPTSSGNTTYNWTVPDPSNFLFDVNDQFSLYLRGTGPIDDGYSNMTNRFQFVDAGGNPIQPQPRQESRAYGHSLSAGQIAGIAVGTVLAFFVCAAGLVLLLWYLRKKSQVQAGHPEEKEALATAATNKDIESEAWKV